MDDTGPAIGARHHEALMNRAPEERFIMGALMFDAARDMALASIPDEPSTIEARTKYFLRMYQGDFPADALSRILNWIRRTRNEELIK